MTLRLRSLQGFYSLTPAQKRDICNGAGAAGAWYSRFIPNTLYGLDCTVAFDRHDYGYWAGFSQEVKKRVDLDLLVNLVTLINRAAGESFRGRVLARLRRRRALTYYEAVHHKGSKAFWAHKPHFRRRGK